MDIISRSEWGARPWADQPSTVSLDERTEYFTHYDGATHITRTGFAIPRAIDAEHHGNGWSGIGYAFVVSQAGEIFEGRGWDLQQAHCPGHNRSGFGVQIAIGGDQEPSKEALAASRWLYDEACRRTGRTLAKKGHKDGYATDCPGDKLYAWVQAGMPADAAPSQPTKPAPSKPAPSAPAFPGHYLRNYTEGHGTRAWQQRMKDRRWPITVDDEYGKESQRICFQFQREKGLHQDGVVGPETWAAAFRTDNVT